jgi:hypothetical protein
MDKSLKRPARPGQAGSLATKEKSHDPKTCKQYSALLSKIITFVNNIKKLLLVNR